MDSNGRGVPASSSGFDCRLSRCAAKFAADQSGSLLCGDDVPSSISLSLPKLVTVRTGSGPLRGDIRSELESGTGFRPDRRVPFRVSQRGGQDLFRRLSITSLLMSSRKFV
jgi:hypothetical protein